VENITGSRTLDVMLYTMRLGPSLVLDLNEHLGLSAGAGPAVGIVSGSLKYNDVINGTSVSNKGQIDATDLVYGGYANATLLYHVPGEKGDLLPGRAIHVAGQRPPSAAAAGRTIESGRTNLCYRRHQLAVLNSPFSIYDIRFTRHAGLLLAS